MTKKSICIKYSAAVKPQKMFEAKFLSTSLLSPSYLISLHIHDFVHHIFCILVAEVSMTWRVYLLLRDIFLVCRSSPNNISGFLAASVSAILEVHNIMACCGK